MATFTPAHIENDESTMNPHLVNGHESTHVAQTYQEKDTPIENFRHMKVIVIGSGFSDIYCGVRIPEHLRNVS
jgi:hypothetical protein